MDLIKLMDSVYADGMNNPNHANAHVKFLIVVLMLSSCVKPHAIWMKVMADQFVYRIN